MASRFRLQVHNIIDFFTDLMIAKSNLLIINKAQFGYHIDSFKYCQYLKSSLIITYLCWDYGLPKIQSAGIDVKYIPRNKNRYIGYYRFLMRSYKEIKYGSYDLVFFPYFLGVSLLRISNFKKKFILDIRTGSVKRNTFSNIICDRILKFESRFFKNVSIISAGLAKKLNIRKCHILPLGGECFSSNLKTFKKIHLLYVGTLQGRNIMDCVRGFHYYIKNIINTSGKDHHFTIVGHSPDHELEEIKTYIKKYDLNDFITLTGYVPNDMLKNYFEKANIGISYIPKTSFFEHQPPTKTYEYLLSGLPVLGTKTDANSRILTSACGVLIDDNVESFVSGLSMLILNKNKFHSENIRNSHMEHLWENIITYNFRPYIFRILRN